MLDLEPASRVLAGLVREVRDDQLGSPTPCQGVTVADLVDHVRGLSVVFAAAAAKAHADAADVSPTADGAPPLERLIGSTGRDPVWHPPPSNP
jgi:uncharacterized protein (TIGR03083 family)